MKPSAEATAAKRRRSYLSMSDSLCLALEIAHFSGRKAGQYAMPSFLGSSRIAGQIWDQSALICYLPSCATIGSKLQSLCTRVQSGFAPARVAQAACAAFRQPGSVCAKLQKWAVSYTPQICSRRDAQGLDQAQAAGDKATLTDSGCSSCGSYRI